MKKLDNILNPLTVLTKEYFNLTEWDGYFMIHGVDIDTIKLLFDQLEKELEKKEEIREKWYRRYVNTKSELETLKLLAIKLRSTYDKDYWSGTVRKILDKFDKEIEL